MRFAVATFERIWEQISVRDISPAGEARLRVLVQRAADRMDREGRTGTADFKHAANGASVLLDRAADEAARQRGRSEVSVTELGIAMDGLCPGFWPFC